MPSSSPPASEAEAKLTGLPAEEGVEKGNWIDADPIPGCVVVNVGEMWEIWSSGIYRSTLHRVVHRGQNYRLVKNASHQAHILSPICLLLQSVCAFLL